jgi:hypothetical protein
MRSVRPGPLAPAVEQGHPRLVVAAAACNAS